MNDNRSSCPLTVRQLDYLECFARGMNHQQVADTLVVTYNTAHNAQTKILRTLNVATGIFWLAQQPQ